MMRDYIAHEIQEELPSIRKLQTLEQSLAGKQRQEKKDIENSIAQQRQVILKTTHSPSAIYQFLGATKDADGTAFRTEWQRKEKFKPLQEDIRKYYEGSFKEPKINLDILPAYSFTLQFTFVLAQSFISRDEQDFYIIDNPIRKDKIFGLPYIAPASWKGSLRAALWHVGKKEKDERIVHLFGNEKKEEDQEKLCEGRLHFFPTFFTEKGLEVINPHDRELRVGINPILFECVPQNASGTFTLLYVPFDRVGKDEQTTRKQVAEDLQLVAEGVQAMFCTYGFGAKTSSGFGLAKETVSNGLLRARVMSKESQQIEEKEVASPSSPTPSLARYLEAADRLKPEYLTPEGIFRERTEVELKKMKKSDRQEYDKAKKWWESKGKQLAEEAKEPKALEPIVVEKPQQAQTIEWPACQFKSFEELVTRATKEKEELIDGGVV